MVNERLKEIINKLEEELMKTRHQLHRHPELANEEFVTTETLWRLLGEVDIKVLNLKLDTGLVAEISGDKSGPVVALRCDIDALPIQERTGLVYQSEISGKMHACGHDFHTTVILGAAYLLKQMEEGLKGTVRIIFQPAEEIGHGAEKILKTGILSDVNVIFGLHNSPDLNVGTLGTCAGPLYAAVDRFEIKITGVGTHAACPEKGVDPIIIAANTINALQTIISRNISAFDQGLISVTHVSSGNTWNVIPETAYIEGTVRTLDSKVRDIIPKKMKQIASGIAQSFGGNAEFLWYPGPPATNNDPVWTEFAADVAKKVGYNVIKVSPNLIGEDFASYQELIPGVFVNIGAGPSYPLHHPQFTVDDSALLLGSKYFADLVKQAINKLLCQEEI